ncbi:MAG TPA: PfkB family carbohydrate kinase, partial [Acidimicrobiales bacterium]|nr:PfkB family carbohydrate kinase [Acidimicrobiales bacterium]
SRLESGDVEAAIAEGADHVHVSGYVLLDPATRSVGAGALATARAVGATTSVDVCSVAPLRAMGAAAFLAAAVQAQTLFANEEEALALTGAGDAARAEAELSKLFDEVVITLGPRGASARRGREGWATNSWTADAVDTTGAGDAATGAYLGARLSGVEPGEAIERAMVAAARVVGTLGA